MRVWQAGENGISLVAPGVPFLRQGNEDPRGYATGNFIGGTTSALGERLPAGNVIAGNKQSGIYIFRGGANKVQGNFIGLGIDGMKPIPHGTDGVGAPFCADGVFIEEGTFNDIGGDAAGLGNVISGNIGDGVRIIAPTHTAILNDVKGNLIGTTADGMGRLGNGSNDDPRALRPVLPETAGATVAASPPVTSAQRASPSVHWRPMPQPRTKPVASTPDKRRLGNFSTTRLSSPPRQGPNLPAALPNSFSLTRACAADT